MPPPTVVSENEKFRVIVNLSPIGALSGDGVAVIEFTACACDAASNARATNPNDASLGITDLTPGRPLDRVRQVLDAGFAVEWLYEHPCVEAAGTERHGHTLRHDARRGG